MKYDKNMQDGMDMIKITQYIYIKENLVLTLIGTWSIKGKNCNLYKNMNADEYMGEMAYEVTYKNVWFLQHDFQIMHMTWCVHEMKSACQYCSHWRAMVMWW